MIFVHVSNEELLHTLSKLSNIIWHEFFPAILSSEQIDYMVDKFQSYEAMKKQINDGYEYYLLKLNNEYIGYTGIKKEESKLFISKIYLLKEYRGKHLTKNIFEFFDDVCIKNKLTSQYLTVNKYNTNAINVYLHNGFCITDAVVTDIGNGYVMDDYIMEKLRRVL